MSEMEPEGPRLQPIEGSGESGSGTRAGVGADEALQGFPIAATPRGGLARRRMAPVVAGALRVAVDHLIAGQASSPTLRLTADDAALEVRLEGIDSSGLAPAGEVLESVEGHLGVVPGVPGTWMIRVPLLTPNETFLLLEQGSMSLAVPWHAVVRMRLASREALARTAEQEGYTILPPSAPLLDPLGELPVVLLGLGLRRAYLLADQIIWRMAAEPTDEAAPRGRGLGPMVRTHEGIPYVMLDTVHMLREVALPPLPHVHEPADRREETWSPNLPMTPEPEIETDPAVSAPVGTSGSGAAQLALAALDASDLEAMPADASEPSSAPAFPAGPPVLRLVELSTGDVEPIDEPAPVPVPAPRALVAEDSIVAAIFLTRLLEKEGFEVVPVGTAAELHELASRAEWSVVFADVELPDATAGHAFAGLEPRTAAGTPAPVVALVRDSDDMARAGVYGVMHTLLKPFEAERLLGLLAELGFPRR